MIIQQHKGTSTRAGSNASGPHLDEVAEGWMWRTRSEIERTFCDLSKRRAIASLPR
jgi:hypothetical protein